MSFTVLADDDKLLLQREGKEKRRGASNLNGFMAGTCWWRCCVINYLATKRIMRHLISNDERLSTDRNYSANYC